MSSPIGTAANVVGLRAMLRPWQGVVCAESAHLNVDEGGAPEAMAGRYLQRAIGAMGGIYGNNPEETVYPNYALDEAGQEAFGRRLGGLVPHPTVPSLAGTAGILDIDGSRGERASSWHTDVTFVPAYPAISILRAVTLPATRRRVPGQ